MIRDSLWKSDLQHGPDVQLGIVALNSVQEVLVARDLVKSQTTEDVDMLGATLASRGIDPRCVEILMSMFRITTKDPLPGWNVERLK